MEKCWRGNSLPLFIPDSISVDGHRGVGDNSCSSAAFHSMRERSGRCRFIDIFPSFFSGVGDLECDITACCHIPNPLRLNVCKERVEEGMCIRLPCPSSSFILLR